MCFNVIINENSNEYQVLLGSHKALPNIPDLLSSDYEVMILK